MEREEIFDLGTELGARSDYLMQKLTIYFPSKKGNLSKDPIENIEDYIEAAMHLLAKINLGVTRLPSGFGVWIDRQRAEETEARGEELTKHDLDPEQTVLVYSYLTRPKVFKQRIREIRRFLHKFGRETQQDAVWVEYFGEPLSNGSEGNGSLYCRIYSIEQYDDRPG
jgi:hypothetical protein